MKTMTEKPQAQTQKGLQANAQAEKNHLNHVIAQPTKATEEEKKAALELINDLKPKTAEDKIKSSERFNIISEKYKKLKVKHDELLLFKAGNDKTKTKITFTNDTGFHFEIQNTNVIEKLTNCATDELNNLLADAEKEVINFQL